MLEETINSLLLTDFAEFVSSPSSSGLAIVRNGFYARHFKTKYGTIEVRVPRDRANLYADKLPPYRQNVGCLDARILALYDRGMTYADISALLRADLGIAVSENAVQAVVNAAYGRYEEFMKLPVPDCPFVFMDGTWITLKREYEGGPTAVARECAMVVIGITPHGEKRVLGFWVRPYEGAGSWGEILEDLKRRGLKSPRLFITDSLQGMPEAVARAFPEAGHQSCLVHVARNIAKAARKRDRAAILEDFKAVYTRGDQGGGDRGAESVRGQVGDDLQRTGEIPERSEPVPVLRLPRAGAKVAVHVQHRRGLQQLPQGEGEEAGHGEHDRQLHLRAADSLRAVQRVSKTAKGERMELDDRRGAGGVRDGPMSAHAPPIEC